MANRINDAQRNRQADSAASSFDGGTLSIRSGSQPASAGDAASGTLICTITLPNPCCSAASSGSAAKTGTWSGSVTTGGTIGYGRFISSSGDRRHDISITAFGGGGDAELVDGDSTTVAEGDTVTIDAFSFIQPAS